MTSDRREQRGYLQPRDVPDEPDRIRGEQRDDTGGEEQRARVIGRGEPTEETWSYGERA